MLLQYEIDHIALMLYFSASDIPSNCFKYITKIENKYYTYIVAI